VKRNERGYSMMEIVVVLAIFGVFLLILVIVTAEMNNYEKKMPVNFMAHPQVISVLSRMRRDVLDAFGANPYPPAYPPGKDTYKQAPKTLIVTTLVGAGLQTVVWDFSTAGEVKRISYNVGVPTEWVARGLPDDFAATFDAVETPGRPYGVRVQAFDKKGMLSVDEYFQPRVHGSSDELPAPPPIAP
jgi:prepilin-type N-terminal cleavage/methylation domain-containing protein